jgi:hypothetical protein
VRLYANAALPALPALPAPPSADGPG